MDERKPLPIGELGLSDLAIVETPRGKRFIKGKLMPDENGRDFSFHYDPGVQLPEILSNPSYISRPALTTEELKDS